MSKGLLFIFFLSTVLFVSAQNITKGIICDSVSGQPLVGANVTLMQKGKPLTFVKTDIHGKFCISAKEGDGISISYIGYHKKDLPVMLNKCMTVKLSPSDFVLKEIKVRGGRISGRQDTVSFDLKRFANERDNSLKDVLKKLPGVDIAKNGAISFNGKEISRFTVEGLDLTGGRYNKMEESLHAKDVDRAEIIEHDQPVKALQNKVFTDNIAMNVKLKPEARDRWTVTLKPVLKVGFPLKESDVCGGADALQIGKQRQCMYDGDYDVTGRDLSLTDVSLAPVSTVCQTPVTDLPSWLNVPELKAPIDDDRLRFNRSCNFTFKRTSKLRNDNELRVTGGYLHSAIDQTTHNTSLYYFDALNPQRTDETANLHLCTDRLYLDLNRNVNRDKSYGNEYFIFEGTRTDALSLINNSGDSTIMQRIKVPEIHLANTFYRIFTHGRSQFSIYSAVDFRHSLSQLSVNGDTRNINTSQFYTDNSASLLFLRRYYNYSCDMGVRAENLVAAGGNLLLVGYAVPKIEYRRGRVTLSAKLPMLWERFVDQKQCFFHLSPFAFFDLKSGNHNEWYIYTGYTEKAGDWSHFVMTEYKMDYRSTMITNGLIPQTNTFNCGINYNYKRPVKELFWSCSAYFNRSWDNSIVDMSIDNGKYNYKVETFSHTTDYFSANSKFSKGFFDLHLKTRLDLAYNHSQGTQISSGKLSVYKTNVITVSPQILFSPSWCDISYSADYTFNRSNAGGMSLRTLNDWRQQFSVTGTLGKIDLTWSLSHYHNELQTAEKVNTLLADVSTVLRLKTVRIEAALHNLFDRHLYSVTSYNGNLSSTDAFQLRPRELVVTVQFSL